MDADLLYFLIACWQKIIKLLVEAYLFAALIWQCLHHHLWGCLVSPLTQGGLRQKLIGGLHVVMMTS